MRTPSPWFMQNYHVGFKKENKVSSEYEIFLFSVAGTTQFMNVK